MQLYRDQFAQYLNVTPGTSSEKWVREGSGVDSLSMSFNPQIDQYKTIDKRNASATFQNYQIQSSISNKRLYSEDEIYKFLDEARRGAKAIETQLLEVDMANTKNEGSYIATKYDILIVINEFLGEDATISYDIYVTGEPIQGTATIAGGTPSFTESVD